MDTRTWILAILIIALLIALAPAHADAWGGSGGTAAWNNAVSALALKGCWAGWVSGEHGVWYCPNGEVWHLHLSSKTGKFRMRRIR
jgi:ABC-type cobalt transport system substrate-binding protein